MTKAQKAAHTVLPSEEAPGSEVDVPVVSQPPRQRGYAAALWACGGVSAVTLALVGLSTRASWSAASTPPHEEYMEKILISPQNGDGCTARFKGCLDTRCCAHPDDKCYSKNEFWAMCVPDCTPGQPRKGDTTDEPWDCEELWSPAGVKKAWQASENFARTTVGRMENTAKMALLHGHGGGNGYSGYINVNYPFGDKVQSLTMNDGPQGYNFYQSQYSGSATQFPCLLALAATFDPQASKRYATAIAEEFVTKGANVMLGPDVEVTRATLAGRSYETLSGEDPFLGAALVQPFVRAVQEKGIIATVKHWLDNNQEIYRQTMSADVGERAQHEIWMPVFKAAFDAGAGAVMCSYNKVNGTHACENEHVLGKLLREDLGFKGYVVSDWGATHDGKKSAMAGLDVEMPGSRHMDDVAQRLDTDKALQERVHEMAVHVISAMHYVGHFDGRFPIEGHLPAWGLIGADATNEQHTAVALDTILESAVLLKNEGATLPIEPKGKTIAMIGKYCGAVYEKSYSQGSVWAGGGSGYVETNKGTTPLDSVKKAFKGAKIVASNDATAAVGADVAVLCVAGHSEEGWDRDNLTLPDAENLIKSVRGVSDAKVVLLAAVPGAVETEWMDDVDAALMLFMPGEQVGPAVAKLLSGEVSPSGRLPVSFPDFNESRFTQKQYPGWCPGVKNGWCDTMTAHFTEDVLVGYRWNDAMGVASAYPFGFGLTYTDFNFGSFEAKCVGKKVMVYMDVTNVGTRDGAAVPQVYVGFPSLQPALRQLRGFKKVQVKAGETTQVIFTLDDDDWSFYDVDAGRWKSAMEDKKEYVTISVGFSSAHLLWNHAIICPALPASAESLLA